MAAARTPWGRLTASYRRRLTRHGITAEGHTAGASLAETRSFTAAYKAWLSERERNREENSQLAAKLRARRPDLHPEWWVKFVARECGGDMADFYINWRNRTDRQAPADRMTFREYVISEYGLDAWKPFNDWYDKDIENVRVWGQLPSTRPM